MAKATLATAAPAKKLLGLTLTPEEAQGLPKKKAVSLENRTLGEMGVFLLEVHKQMVADGRTLTWGEFLSDYAANRCPGIKINSYAEWCGLYLRPLKVERCL